MGQRSRRRLRAAAVSAQEQDRRARPDHLQDRHHGAKGYHQAPHRGRHTLRADRAALPLAAMRLRLDRGRQRAWRGGAMGEAHDGRGTGAGGVGVNSFLVPRKRVGPTRAKNLNRPHAEELTLPKGEVASRSMWPPPSFERVHARACTLLRMRTESRWRATSYPTLLANRARWVNALAMSACAAAIDLYLVTVSAYRRAISATAADLTDLSALSVASAASKAARSIPALRSATRY